MIPDIHQVPFKFVYLPRAYCSATSPCENEVLFTVCQDGTNFSPEESRSGNERTYCYVRPRPSKKDPQWGIFNQKTLRYTITIMCLTEGGKFFLCLSFPIAGFEGRG